MTTIIIGLFIVAALASIPIAHALVLAAVGGLLIVDRVPVHLAVEQMITQTQSFPLIAIPFFMMTGALMVSGRLGQSLVNLLTMMIGRVHGEWFQEKTVRPIEPGDSGERSRMTADGGQSSRKRRSGGAGAPPRS